MTSPACEYWVTIQLAPEYSSGEFAATDYNGNGRCHGAAMYDIRSSIVHGSKLSKDKRDWLVKNCRDLELRVRQVLTAAVQNVPAEEAERRTMLAALYDPTDEDRGEFALQKFREIRTEAIRREIAEKIGRVLNG